MSSCYYSLIRRTSEGRLVGWMPDLPGITADGEAEDDIVRELARGARDLVARMASKGLPLPPASTSDVLPIGDRVGRYRRLLIVLS